MSYHSSYNLSIKTAEARKQSLKLVQDKFDSGVVTLIDLNQAKSQLYEALKAIPRYKRDIEIAENKLSTLMGINPTEFKFDPKIHFDKINTPQVPVLLPTKLLSRRPDVLQAEEQLKSANAEIGYAIGNALPKLSLNGSAGHLHSESVLSDHTDWTAWNIGANLAGPLFHWGQNLDRIDIAKEQTKAGSIPI